MSTNNTNLAGEFYAMHVLFRIGLVPALTLGNTKGVDILVLNPKNEKQFKVEVKTTTNSWVNEKNFGGRNINWRLHKKHETDFSDDLIYCFVQVQPNHLVPPRIFFIKSKEVADYVTWEHAHWLHKIPHKRQVKNTDMRTFRILEADMEKYENNFELFD